MYTRLRGWKRKTKSNKSAKKEFEFWKSFHLNMEEKKQKKHTHTLGKIMFITSWCAYLWLGCGQSDPYSWTCIPKKQTSAPSMSSKAKRAFVLYGKDSDISPLSTNLKKKKKTWVQKQDTSHDTTLTSTQISFWTAWILVKGAKLYKTKCYSHKILTF